MSCPICLIEDDEILGEALMERFEVEKIACDWFKDGESALRGMNMKRYCVAVSDINMPDMSGETLFKRLLDGRSIPPPFLFITGYGSVAQAVRLLKMGAGDYLSKPFDVCELISKVRAHCPLLLTRRDSSTSGLLGISSEMQVIEAALTKLSASASTVLIRGESGVGKEYVVKFLHQRLETCSPLPFIAVNCGAVPEHLLEAELFGYEKGAFTGAIQQKRGLFEQAHGGTLFLDEIGDMPFPMQVKILRAIQERSIRRIGSEQIIPVDFRLACATHRDLEQMVKTGEFREDLYYRINVLNIHVPPLRERKKDILWYAQTFLEQYPKRKGGRHLTLHPKAEQVMLVYPWPGNIRELRNCMERACVLSPSSVIMPEFLFGGAWQSTLANFSDPRGETLAQYVKQCERDYICRVLTDNNNRIGNTATALGISRKTLWDKMRKLKLKKDF